MALLDLGKKTQNLDQSQTVSLSPLAPQEAAARGAYLQSGTDQAGLYSALLGHEFGKLFGNPGQAAIPTPNQQGFAPHAATFSQGIFNSPEAAAYLSGAPIQNVIQNAYANILGRQASPQEIQNWINTGQGGQAIVQNIINSPEFQQRMGGLTAEQGLQGLYSGVLGREASGGELANWYGAAGMPAAQDAIAATPPNALPHQALFDLADQMMNERLSGGKAISDQGKQLVTDTFAPQRQLGLDQLMQQAQQAAAERGFDTAATPISDPWARAQTQFLSNIGGAEAGALLNQGNTEFGQLAGLMNLQGNLQTEADRNRLALVTGNPTAAYGGNQLATQLQLGAATRNNNVSQTGTNVGTSVGGSDLGGLLQFGQQAGLGSLFSAGAGMFRDLFNRWNTNSAGGANGVYGPFNDEQFGPSAPVHNTDFTSEAF